MSLITLLADFPNYSARKVRRLAKQLAALDKACDPSLLPEQRGIAQDLMEFNLLQAKNEAQMNDDVRIDVPQGLMPLPKTENVVVTPVKEAMRAIDDLTQSFQELDDVESAVKRAKGIVSGSAFTVERDVQ